MSYCFSYIHVCTVVWTLFFLSLFLHPYLLLCIGGRLIFAFFSVIDFRPLWPVCLLYVFSNPSMSRLCICQSASTTCMTFTYSICKMDGWLLSVHTVTVSPQINLTKLSPRKNHCGHACANAWLTPPSPCSAFNTQRQSSKYSISFWFVYGSVMTRWELLA